MKSLIVLIAIVFLTIFAYGQESFSKEEFVKSITFGAYCGECGIGRMNKTYYFHFKDQALKTSKYGFYPTRFYSVSSDNQFDILIEDSNKEFRVSKILNLITNRIILTGEEKIVYGCPDCRDGGGIYIKLEFHNKSKIIQLPYSFKSYPFKENSKPPEDVLLLAEKILLIMDELD